MKSYFSFFPFPLKNDAKIASSRSKMHIFQSKMRQFTLLFYFLVNQWIWRILRQKFKVNRHASHYASISYVQNEKCVSGPWLFSSLNGFISIDCFKNSGKKKRSLTHLCVSFPSEPRSDLVMTPKRSRKKLLCWCQGGTAFKSCATTQAAADAAETQSSAKQLFFTA